MGICLGADLDQTFTSLDEGKTPGLGDVFWGTGGKVYKFVQYDAGTAAVAGVAGEVTYYNGTGAYGTFIVTSDVSDTNGVGAGVLQAAAADQEYCWVQIKGPATLSIALTAGANGDSLTPTGAGDGTLDLATAAETDHICAQVDDAATNKIVCDFPW
jgi:hypothetical protein